MEELHTYLRKYQTLKPPQQSKIKLFLQVVYDECGITLTEKVVSLTRGGVSVRCHPTVRSELMQCAPKVLATLHKEHNIHLAFIR